MRRDVFQAIADPVRREIIHLVSSGTHTLNGVAEKFNISRPAISKHVKILTECGLVVIRQRGRQRYCEPQLKKLNEVSRWVEQYRGFWTKRLDALGGFLDKEMKAEKAKAAPAKSKRTGPKKAALMKKATQ